MQRVDAKDYIEVMAEVLIKRHRLRRADGTVMCWGCFARDALMPHLHCEQCYEDYRRRNGR